MPLRNRVTPFKQIHAVSERGAWMGNRGNLHDSKGELRRLWNGTRWIICQLEFQGRRRELVSPGKYTELFFLDEATALAAGHRPCKECRRDAAKQFLSLSEFKSLKELDAALHPQRIAHGSHPLTCPWQDLPSGTIIGWGYFGYLVNQGRLFLWSHAGYTEVESIEQDLHNRGVFKSEIYKRAGTTFQSEPICLVPPQITVDVLRAGYPVQIHPSVNATP